MPSYICFLITILNLENNSLIQCAIKVDTNKLTGDCEEFPMEIENRKQFYDLLPYHVQNCGPIVNVETLFAIHDATI